MTTRLLCTAAALAILLVIPASAGACASDQSSYLDSFPDAECLLLGSGTEIDADGGLRLKTGGTATPTIWDTDAQFDDAPAGDPGSLQVVGASTAATLELQASELPLTRQFPAQSPTGAELVAGPTPVRDNEGVEDPSVIKAGNKYVMYYTGYAEDGSPPAIFRTESDDGRSGWSAAAQVLTAGALGSFDASGVFGADVVYDVTDATAPYRMYYSGASAGLRAIGYATSTDGVTWVKNGTGNGGLPQPVLNPGLPGSRDAFAVAHPAVMKDGQLYKMWYEGDDSTVKSIGYATSTDGVIWKRGGFPATLQQDPLNPGDPKVGQGVGAPAVWKTSNGFRMVVVARNGGNPTSTRLMDATSTNGIDWSDLSPLVNSQSGSFYASNFLSPDMLEDPSDNTAAYKLYFAGDRAISASGTDDRARIGVATGNSATGSLGVFAGSGTNQSIYEPGGDSTRFDARNVLGVSVADPGAANPWVGAYAGTRSTRNVTGSGTVSTPAKLGIASYDPQTATWTKIDGAQADKSILALGGTGEDSGGQRDPALVYKQVTAGGTADWWLFYTALPTNGSSPSVRLASSDEANAQNGFRPTTWTKLPGSVIANASHPSVVRDASAPVRIYHTLEDGTPSSIALTASTGTDDLDGPYDAATAVSFTGASTCDTDGASDPVVIKIGTILHMLYTGWVGTARNTCYATADTASSYTQFTRKGFVISPSDVPFAYDERAIKPVGMFVDSETVGAPLNVYFRGTDRGERKWVELSPNVYELQVFNQRTRVGRATSPVPILAGRLPSGSATGEIGSVTGPLLDFRRVTRVKSGATVEMFMSVLQPYSTPTNQFWSDWFPVITGTSEDTASQDLTFRFGVRAARWRARLSDPSGAPKLDKVTVESGPLQFEPTGTATTKDIAPPEGFQIGSWTSLVLSPSTFTFPGGTSSTVGGTVTVLGTGDAPVVPATPITFGSNSDQTISLASVAPAQHPKLRVKLDLSSSGGTPQSTPLIKQLRVQYTSAKIGADSDGDGVLDTADQCPTVAAPGQANGCPADTDGDGIPDTADACPTVAAPGQANGCPPDADRDGVPDAQDACAQIPAPGSPNGCPLALTFGASALTVVYGSTITLSGLVVRGPAPVPGQVVTVLGQAVGTAAPKLVGTAISDITGKWTLVVKPAKHTTYSVLLAGVPAPAPVAVKVAHKLTLKVSGKGGRRTFSGALGPKHAKRSVVIQRRSGSRWVTFARVRTGTRSTFKVTKSLARRKRYQFRVTTAADKEHLKGTSKVARVRT